MDDLSPSSTSDEIVKNLGKCDPVYDSEDYKDGKRLSVKRCALCGRISGHNQENVNHTMWCPWIWSMKKKYPEVPANT